VAQSKRNHGILCLWGPLWALYCWHFHSLESTQLSCSRFTWYLSLQATYVKKPKNTLVTMADFDDNGGSFTLVEDSHRGKKHKVSEQEPPRTNHSYEMPTCILFQANAIPGTKISLAVHVRMLTEELSCADKAVSFLSIDKKTSYYPNNDKFSEDEGKFKEFFTIHYPTCKTAHLVTVRCILRTTKTISEMKKALTPTPPFSNGCRRTESSLQSIQSDTMRHGPLAIS